MQLGSRFVTRSNKRYTFDELILKLSLDLDRLRYYRNCGANRARLRRFILSIRIVLLSMLARMASLRYLNFLLAIVQGQSTQCRVVVGESLLVLVGLD